ncbi:TetR/AcrR family transcriptional regulator [Piscinibacter sp. HJYY11]|uniref:TetR/AcrR family transcriptional regulator n=1 Tax=Piscinibacter sp. HJYY11 TaxID=2801333 RepID=UPI00191D9978|nr:TetR/AcrR family transcriptional regulator [Piscinibacter sp. HJYY11]MBL0730969.1 TetR family transcriptional regulator C-terminal domain-containing protein [Piscinibacter sp. HJYY11]
MPRTADPTDIPNRLLSAGRDLFLQRGYNATGIQQITDAASVPKGSFYNHFSSKEAFAAAVAERYAGFMCLSWERMMATAPTEPMAAIRHVFAQMTAYHERHADRPSGCLIGNFASEIALVSESCRETLLAAQLGWRERLAGLIRTAQADGVVRDDVDATELSALTWATWQGALLRMKVERSVQPLRDTITLLLDRFYPAQPT